MITRRQATAVAAAAMLYGSAPAFDFQLGPVTTDVLIALGGQGAAVRGARDTPGDTEGHLTANAWLNLEWIDEEARMFGLRASFDNGTRRGDELSGSEVYGYFASEFGRIELGRQDGAADTLSLHAPVVGLGQVRGDFSYYAGRNASLSPRDTRDSPKLIYLSPPLRGLRVGLSYAPEFSIDAHDPDPRRRVIVENAVEAGAQYQSPLGNDWVLGASAALTRGNADPVTQRHDLSAWSSGMELRHDSLVIGGAYVRNGDSNDLTSDLVRTGEREWNLGAAWRATRWGTALSHARIHSRDLKTSLLGLGGYYRAMNHLVLRADAVHVRERINDASDRYYVLLVEASCEF